MTTVGSHLKSASDRHRTATVVAVVVAASLTAGGLSRGEPAEPTDSAAKSAPPHWQPGERVTATLDGELDHASMTTSSDGTYGRFAGDLTLALGAGAEIPTGDDPARAGARISAHYFWMAGIYGGYARTIDANRRAELLGFGADLRPAFLPRFIRNMEHGPALLDLMLDSISLGVGAFFADGDEQWSGSRGLEASVGLSVPLFGKATGLWLDGRGMMRWPEGHGAQPAVWVALSYHQVVLTPLTRQAADAEVRF